MLAALVLAPSEPQGANIEADRICWFVSICLPAELVRHTVYFAFSQIEIWKRLLFLQEKYSDVASELIVYAYFFSASEQVFPEASL